MRQEILSTAHLDLCVVLDGCLLALFQEVTLIWCHTPRTWFSCCWMDAAWARRSNPTRVHRSFFLTTKSSAVCILCPKLPFSPKIAGIKKCTDFVSKCKRSSLWRHFNAHPVLKSICWKQIILPNEEHLTDGGPPTSLSAANFYFGVNVSTSVFGLANYPVWKAKQESWLWPFASNSWSSET